MELKKFTNKNKKIIIVMTLAILTIAIVAGGYLLLNSDKYEQYTLYNEKNKNYGEVEHYEKENDEWFISLFYPKTKNKDLDKVIDNYYKNLLKEEKVNKKSKDVLYLDYSSEIVYDQYVNFKFIFQRFNDENKVLANKEKIFTFDLKQNKVLTVDDCLRRSYQNTLHNLNGIENIKGENNRLKITKNSLIIYPDTDLKNKISINYKENKDVIKLANKNIPSNAPLNVAMPKPQPKVDPNKKMVAITLDDGPHKNNTLRAIELFEKYNGRATFFMLGKNVKLYPDVVKTVYEHGFEIGSHSWDHPDLRKLNAEAVNKQIIDTQNEIFEITGFEPSIIRPPYGATNEISKSIIANNNMKIALWNLDTEDWKLKDANKIKDIIINNTFDGAVILIHDIHNFSIDGLEMALAELSNRGYQFVTLETLLQYHELKNVLR